jgi:hypothetical protein
MAVYQLASSKIGTLRWRRNFSAPSSACARVATTRRLPCPWPLIRSMNASGSLPLAAVSTRSPVAVRRICAFSSRESALCKAPVSSDRTEMTFAVRRISSPQDVLAQRPEQGRHRTGLQGLLPLAEPVDHLCCHQAAQEWCGTCILSHREPFFHISFNAFFHAFRLDYDCTQVPESRAPSARL